MKGERIRTVTASMIRAWKSCRRRFWFSYIEQLRPRVAARPLTFGRVVHDLLADYLRGRDLPTSHEAFRELYASEEEWRLALEEMGPQKALIAVESWGEWVMYDALLQGMDVLDVEVEFKVNCGYAKRLAGKMDGLARLRVSGREVLAILEHKTASNPDDNYLHRLLWDDQATAYIYAAREMGLDVEGILYNIIPKCPLKPYSATPEEKRKYRKDGKLYANQREEDETEDEYLQRVRKWYAEHAKQFTAHLVYRNAKQLQRKREEFEAVIRDMKAAEREETYYPNPGACRILSCPFEGICLEDTPEAREGGYVNKTKQHEELDRDGEEQQW
jgi:hypothetical protein